MKCFFLLIYVACAPFALLRADTLSNNLLSDLLIVDYWNQKLNDRMPVTYNNYLQGGYFIMPSARMGYDGEVGFGYASVPPYRVWNLRCQLSEFLEVTCNYRIFSGVDDPILTPLGFGDMSDKGVNLKATLFRPEDSGYRLPGIAIGFDDILGTRNFKARYIVATKVFIEQDMEISLGYGKQRIRGWFGGFAWMPWRKYHEIPWLQGFTLALEYDATPYESKHIEKHPHGRISRSPINVGFKYRLWDHMDLSVSYIRGAVVACSASAFYNFGHTQGFVPKIDDALPYRSPINLQPISPLRPEEVLVQDLLYAFKDQGFELLGAWMSYNECGEKTLRLGIYNDCYRKEISVRDRLTHLLAALIPDEIAQVTVVIDSEGFPIQEYRFTTSYLRDYQNQDICAAEIAVLTPLEEVFFPEPCSQYELLKRERDALNFGFYPRTNTFFGSSRGKFKYALGVGVEFDGFLPLDVYYSLKVGCAILSDLNHLTGVDRLNPSQLINVRSDVVRYYQQRGLVVDEAYLQKNWSLGNGCYFKAAVGYFEEEYAGIANEFLYYPLKKPFAIGLEGGIFLKRSYHGLGFTTKVRKFDGFIPHYRYFIGSQCFLNFYYDWREIDLDFKASAGKFLANDYGVRFEIARYFPSGLKIYVWYTMTNGHDKINGETYYDKGVGFSMPLDVFLCQCSRARWGNSMSAWLRDVGVQACTGLGLYDLIREQRE